MRQIFFGTIVTICLFANAKQVSIDLAQNIAKDLLSADVALAEPSVSKIKNQSATEAESKSYYIFNQAEGDGFAIIAADDRARKVLGYSHTGHLDINNLPPQLQYILDEYTNGLMQLDEDAPRHASWDVINPNTEVKGTVLKTANWDQEYPYNAQCPVFEDRKHAPTGCVATAAAIIMKYHNWPKSGKGSISYEWNGTTLTADFENSDYRWDLMKDEYIDGQYDQNSVDAVSLLMKDVGYAMQTYYTPNESYASSMDAFGALMTNFGYAAAIMPLSLAYTPKEVVFNTIKNEIDNNRPMLCDSGTLPIDSEIAHTYVVDGYAADDYVHFNFGWSGFCNGFYTIDPFDSQSFAGMNIDFYYGIQPNNKGTDTIKDYCDECYISRPFSYSKSFGGMLSGGYSYRIGYNTAHKIDFGLKFKNIIDGSVTNAIMLNEDTTDPLSYYFDNNSLEEVLSHGAVWTTQFGNGKMIPLPELTDGEYILTQTYRVDDGEWKECSHADYLQHQVALNVKSGEKEFKNIKPDRDIILDGRVYVDGIFYLLDHEHYTAEITKKSLFGNDYVGDVNIPGHITYDGKEYTVTFVGTGAFDSCNLGKLTLPKTIIALKTGCLSGVSLESINLVELENLMEIEPWALVIGDIQEPIRLPRNVRRIYRYAFGGNLNTHFLEIPESVEYIGDRAFCPGDNQLEAIYLKSPYQTIGFGDESPFDENCTLYVPGGMKSYYEQLSHFQNCHIVETDGNITFINDVKVLYKGEELKDGMAINVNDFPMDIEIMVSPANVTCRRFHIDYPEHLMTLVEEKQFQWAELPGFRDSDRFYLGIRTLDGSGIYKFYDMTVGTDASVDSHPANKLHIRKSGGNIIIQGVNPETAIKVYTVDGNCIYSGAAKYGAETTIPANRGLYIVVINGDAYKVIV